MRRRASLCFVPSVLALAGYFLLVGFWTGKALADPGQDEEPQLPDLVQRAFIASSIYAAIPQHFAHWEDVPDLDLEAAYREYLEQALNAETRRQFTLASKRFLATLGNGHTKFSDRALKRNSGSRLRFSIHHLHGQWVVSESEREDLAAGDVVTKIDGQEIEEFFQDQLSYIAHSTERWARRALFGRRGNGARAWLPMHFGLTLADGRQVWVDRSGEVEARQRESTWHWLVPERIAYLRIPDFSPSRFEKRALEILDELGQVEALVIDVRDNFGGTTPGKLTQRLFDRRYPWWSESTPLSFGSIGFNRAAMSWQSWWNEPAELHFEGKIAILIDAGCFSACEDFVMPFKHTGRATLIGEATGGSSGQPHFLRFEDGMVALIGSKREAFPDGSQFESVGVAPDIELVPNVEQLRRGADPLVEKALEILQGED